MSSRTISEVYSCNDKDKEIDRSPQSRSSLTFSSTWEISTDKVLSTQIFYKFINNDRVPISISITHENLIINYHREHIFELQDVLGVTVKEVKFRSTSENLVRVYGNKEFFQLKIHFLIRNNENTTNTNEFLREHEKMKFYTDDKTVAIRWRNLILQASNNPEFKSLWKACGYEDLPHFKRSLLVFINPQSGEKKGNKVWSKAKKLLEKAGCDFVEIFTQASGYAREYIKNYSAKELIKFDGFITVSGDGVMHEIINGIYQRPDWKDFNHIPFGIIPSGTSNGLIKNLLKRSNEVVSIESAIQLIAKGRKIKSDITMLERPDGSRIFFVIIFAWATMAEIDVQSNHLRSLGKLRFTIYGLWNILLLKSYKGRLTYTTKHKELPHINEELRGNDWRVLNEENFRHFSLHNLAWIGSKYQAVPLADFQDGVIHLLALTGDDVSRKKLATTLSKFDGQLFDGDKLNQSTGLYYDKVKAFRLEPNDKESGYYAIDGEAYKATIIQGKVLEKTLTLYGN